MTTLSYYSTNAVAFAADTVTVDFKTTQDRFLCWLKPGAAILDFGCGSGRDSRYFAERGFRVTATDGCPELVKLAREHTGLPVREMLFSELDEIAVYDGIWACASILHLTRAELVDVIKKIVMALMPKGYLYTSFKYGDFAGMRNGRYFTDMTEQSFTHLLQEVDGLELVEYWLSCDVRKGRGDEKWLNLVLRKV